MKLLHALALSIALLVALWVCLSIGMPNLQLNPWIGFVAWATFFAAGGGSQALGKSAFAALAGVVLTAGTMWLVALAGGSLPALALLVAVLAFVLVAMADVAALSYTPAAFLGAATYFGATGDTFEKALFVGLTWVAGLTFGYLSESFGKRMTRAA
ncbi:MULTISPECIES: DUF1097 domain-containing protein [Methyloversatilis]|jgi:hypothetical protein|uniref:DUF1097 domain-containing protein n=1 Tax=Methyloversatilis TaxID=378210 RepID=UPI00036B4E42|nr:MULTISPECIES: DUF1097 domain-containing protein [Methyloversatilis]PZU55592.1 MAG: DUF1097 domain-containing protein [Thauera sp.]MBC7207811.1 DUF1097 domain-containing protein [Methyloversatilis sp.]MBT9518086.1 DUF1097 domain-containing protein [Methyloversatilis discipulorum]MBV5286336.1 DUF1097 domain-containing protein [Methyloversatilis discipulorum]MCP4635137.1 DUF1097 domain-containing protein [Methyloversatilis sp.]